MGWPEDSDGIIEATEWGALSGYNAYAKAASRSVNYIVQLELDRCTLTYGTAPCAAVDLGDGYRCSYTWGTCQDKFHYTRGTQSSYYSLNAFAPPTISGIRALPLIANGNQILDIPQEIDMDKGTTEPRKMKIKFLPDFDQGAADVDKTVRNTQTGGEYWRQLLAKNQNYVNRPLRVYRGFVGLHPSGYQCIADLKLTGFSIDHDGTAILEAMDNLAVLEKNQLPQTVSDGNYIIVKGTQYETMNSMAKKHLLSPSGVYLPCLEITEVPDPATYPGPVVLELGTADGFALDSTIGSDCGREFVVVTGYDIDNNLLTVSRGRYGTIPVWHSGIIHFRQVYYVGQEDPVSPMNTVLPVNPIDVVSGLLAYAGISGVQVNWDSFTRIKNTYYSDNIYKRIVIKPKTIKDLMAEIRTQLGLALYVNRNNLIDLAILGPLLPNQVIGSINDTSHIVEDSQKVIDDPAKRITRSLIYYAPNVDDAGSDPKNFDAFLGEFDIDAESPNVYGDQKPRLWFDSWFSRDQPNHYIASQAARILGRLVNGERRLIFELELKDHEWEVGEFINITSTFNEAVGIGKGEAVTKVYFIIRKTYKNQSIAEYEALDTSFFKAYAVIAPDTVADDWDNASATDRRYAYFSDTNGKIGDAKAYEGYVIW